MCDCTGLYEDCSEVTPFQIPRWLYVYEELLGRRAATFLDLIGISNLLQLLLFSISALQVALSDAVLKPPCRPYTPLSQSAHRASIGFSSGFCSPCSLNARNRSWMPTDLKAPSHFIPEDCFYRRRLASLMCLHQQLKIGLGSALGLVSRAGSLRKPLSGHR